MQSNALATALASMTSRLQPAPGTPPDQLEILRTQLADALSQQDLATAIAGNFSRLDLLSQQPEILREDLLQGFEAQLSAAPLTPSGLRVFRREVPVRTSQHPASVPPWAAGMDVAHTLGPFIDYTGKWYWFDFFRRVHTVSVTRGTDVFMLVPVQGLLLNAQKYKLGEGCVWISSRLLTPSALAGAFTGLKIKGGSISFGQPLTVSGNSLVMSLSDTCHLSLDLLQPVADIATGSQTGTDAKDLSIQLPANLNLECKPGIAVVKQAGDMQQQVYGVASTYTFHSGTPIFEPLLNRILLPYKTSLTTFTAPVDTSGLLSLSGTAGVQGAYWALPLTVAPITQLGNAAGIGAIVLSVEKGVTTNWYGLDKGLVQLGACYLLTEPGRIAITAATASSKKAKQSFELRNETDTPRLIRSQVQLTYNTAFVFLYNCLSTGAEAILVSNANLNAAIDRPLTATGQRPGIQAPIASLYLFEQLDHRLVYLQAVNIIQQLLAAKQTTTLHPVSYALRNAFFRTTPADDLYMAGVWTDEREIKKGALLVDFPIYFFTPTLPDPYVTTYNPLQYVNRLKAGSTGSPGLTLAAFIQWSDPASPAMMLLLMQDNTPMNVFNAVELAGNTASSPIASTHLFNGLTFESSGDTINTSSSVNIQQPYSYSFAAAHHNQTAAVQQEDAANTADLRAMFDKALQTGTEQLFLLDVSTNADLFGVGISIPSNRQKVASIATRFPFFIKDMDLVTYAANTRIYTLPLIQWEPVRTIQNKDVKPYPFPSPVTSANTGDPTLIGTTSYQLVPTAPKEVIATFIQEYKEHAKSMAALFSLPFGMKAVATLDNSTNPTQPGATVDYNRPDFNDPKLSGGLQLSVIATSPDVGPDHESPHFKGATIQTRNLIDLLTGNIPLDDDGKPLSVLGPVVDTIFNGEFKPSGANSRVPVQRIDISGYGASMFSNWLNPNAQIAATSQAKFDVLIGRTAHEIIQVKSILYPWAVAVVRTITIIRTSGGGVTRYDSGWKAQGPGKYDFSYHDAANNPQPNPFEIHPGTVREIDHVTEIRDTGRTYRVEAPNPKDSVIMQEVFFNADVLIENVVSGAADGWVPSRKQRGFVQLSPYQKPLTSSQYLTFLQQEGPLGGPVDCVVNVGTSGQQMRIVTVDVNSVDGGGNPFFVAAGHGTLLLPKEGAWTIVQRKNSSSLIVTMDADSALPLVREGRLSITPVQPYRFADPADLKQASSPDTDYGLLHAMGSQKVLFLRPTIQQNDTVIRSTLTPYLADSYALLGSKGIFPALDAVFPLGGGGSQLTIMGNGRLQLSSGGNFKAPPGLTRNLLNAGNSRIYVDYSDTGGGNTSDVTYSFDSNAAIPWKASVKNHSIVIDLLGFNSVLTVTSDFASDAVTKPGMGKPVMKFGSVLQPIIDLLSFLGNFDMAQAFRVSMGNATTDSWQTKWKASLLGLKIEFPLLQVSVFGVHVGGASDAAQEAFETATPLPPLKLGFEVEIEGHYNMLPFDFKSDDPTTDIAKEKQDMLSAGASLKFGGEIHILCVAISPTLGLYFFGLLELEFGLDSKDGKSFEFKVAVGLELATKWPVVGKVAIAMAIGLDMEFKDNGHGIFALMIFKGEAELLGGLIAIGIQIEAKGGQEKETEDGVDKTFCICEVEFAAEVTLAFVIHFEFDVTWQEKKQLS